MANLDKDLPDVLSERQLQRVSTGRVRYALSQLAQNNIEKVQDLLDAIEKVDGPKAAFDSLMKILEFSVPKLSRTEVAVEDSAGNAAVTQLSIADLEALIRRGVEAEMHTVEGEAHEIS